MKKLKNKVFYVIFSILTLFLISILLIFNSQSYRQEANNVKENLIRMDEDKNKQNNKPPEIEEKQQDNDNDKSKPGIFMDYTIYTAILDENFNVVDVINHTTNNITDDEIKEIAEKIIKENQELDMNIGNLYFDNYSYSFIKSKNSLVIMDNSIIQKRLIQALKTSIIMFILLELIIVYVSKKLTQWIIKPVVEAFNKQKQFIADASHELKTPLSVIMASAEALENEPDEKKWLDNIKSESERMNKLISDLLEMAKSENGFKEQFINEDLSKIAERSVLTFEGLMYEKDIKLDYKIEENIKFLCNGNQIKQLVSILLDNAIKHTYSKGKIEVELKKEKANAIVLTITNQGKEIPKEEQEKIFERFYRIDESRNRNDNRYGLGLAIAKNIVTNHNGEISVISENGHTTFKIFFK